MSRTYVKDALPVCREKGCQAPELATLARHLSEQAHYVLDTMEGKETQMQPTRALWCEQGGHPFSEKDPDVQVLTITGKDADGKVVEESRTSCGECATAAKTRLGKVRNSQATVLPPGES
jgi:hypothetical protein